MKQEDRLREIVGKREPYKVPEGYFDSFRSDVLKNLPSYPEKPQPQKTSVWHRVRPYIYMAAMFAGIWCMMKIFHSVSSDSTHSDQFQDEMAMVMSDPEVVEMEYFLEDQSGIDFEIEDEVIDMYSSIDELKEDFYAL